MHHRDAVGGGRVDHRGTFGAQRVHQRVQHGLHHARRVHLLAHAPQEMVEDLAAPGRGGDVAGVVGELGGVDPGASTAYEALFGVEHRGGGDDTQCAATVG